MKAPRRSAKLDAVLVYMDEPQLITLISRKNSRAIAVAIPDDDQAKSMFFAALVQPRDWEKYLDGVVDLRYIFATQARTLFTFDLASIKDETVMMNPWLDEAPDAWLPSPRFFSDNHTEPYEAIPENPEDLEVLIIDGEWQLPEFGQFQQRYSDIYSFMICERAWNEGRAADGYKKELQTAFTTRPFQGGSSYVHLFSDLSSLVRRSDRLNLSGLSYNSPGFVNILGRLDIFEDLRDIITNFNDNRRTISSKYDGLHGFLSKNHYLTMNVRDFGKKDGSAKYIQKEAKNLSELMRIPTYGTVSELAQDNVLASAKIVLSVFRRLSETATFFAQGRVSYPEVEAVDKPKPAAD